jgi:ribosomal protein L22
MAYYSNLPEEKASEIYNQISEKSQDAARAMFQARLKSAKSKKAKKACEGHYPNEWSNLLSKWINNKVSNLFVYDCLTLNYVPEMA